MKILTIGISIIIMLLAVTACNDEDQNSLVVHTNELNIASEGGSATLLLQTDAKEWRIQNPADWISISPVNGTEPSAEITLTVSTKTIETRSAVLTVLAGSAENQEVLVTQGASEFLYSLTSNFSILSFKKGGSSNTISITTDAPDWEISSDATWLHFDPQSGKSGETNVKITANENVSSEEREAIIKVIAEHTPTTEIAATQIGEYYPNYNTSPLPPDESGMSSTAVELAAEMTLGINIGNTMEAIGGETAWGNPKITKTLIDALKNHGFETIRIPCSFNQYANAVTAEISADWLVRVKEVVQYCVDNDLYVVLNIHWDNGWLENNVTTNKQEEVNARQKALWEQIATHLRDFDEHLIFAGANEPNVENATQMAVLDSYHQTFVDAVRATGGRNSYRVLVIQGASTDIEKTDDLFNAFPTDEVPNKLMAELHYYTPYQFCLMEEDADWGNVFYYWGEAYHSTIDTDRNATWGEEDDLDNLFQIAHSQFVTKGYPVILGEFGAYKRSNIPDQELHNASVEYFNKYVVQACLENGFIPYYWDTGGLINRNSGAVLDQGVFDALLEGAGK